MIRRALVLDLDDTLYLERDFAFSGFAHVAAHLRDSRGISGFAEAARRAFDNGDRARVFDTALTRLGHAPDRALIAELVALYRAHPPQIALAPDAARLLERVPGDCALALLTDGFLETQRNKVAALGLDRRGLTPIVYTDAWGRDYWKPHRKGFELIAAELGLPPSALTYVADNPAKDFVAPRALGWATVQIRRSQGVHGTNPIAPGGHPDRLIASLDELDLQDRAPAHAAA